MQSPFDYMKMPLQRYADFSGRSRRMEYWMFYVGSIGASIVARMIEGILGMGNMMAQGSGPLSALLLLALLVPSIAVLVRRLHDQDKSGWLALLIFIPIIGWLALLVFMFLEGTKGDNQYGPDPKAS